MPQSQKRKSQKHIDYIPHKKKKKSAIPIAILFCALIGMGIGWFAFGPLVPELVIASTIGAIFGYIVGRQMDRSLGNGY